MQLDITFRNQIATETYSRSFFVALLTRAMRILKIPCVGVSVSLISPARMRALNKRYRQTDKVTDVLSFPLYEGGKNRYTEDELGDLFICPAYCARIASQRGMAPKEYVAWSAVHGFLHLCGYDHEKSREDAKKMSAMEKKILASRK